MEKKLKFLMQNLLFCMIIIVFGMFNAGCGSSGAAYFLQQTDGLSAVSVYETGNAAGALKEEVKTDSSGMDYPDTNVTAGSGPVGSKDGDAETKASAEAQIYVYVCGAVNAPGVYQLPENSRVFAAIDAAGGLREDAETRSLNLAEWLEDGMQITVYTSEEVAGGEAASISGGKGTSTGTASENSGQDTSGKVNINTATVEELMTLSGIGESRAADIIAYRNEHGAFSDIQEITNVSGIGEKSFAKIKDQITV